MEQLLDWMAANPRVWALVHHGGALFVPGAGPAHSHTDDPPLPALAVPCLPEVWAYLTLPNGAQERARPAGRTILGRGGNSDVILNYPVVSRQHAALIRQADDTWTAYDLGSKGGVTVNGRPVEGSAPVQYGDVVGIGGVETRAAPLSRRRRTSAASSSGMRPVSPGWGWCSSPCSRPSPHCSSPSARGRTPR